MAFWFADEGSIFWIYSMVCESDLSLCYNITTNWLWDTEPFLSLSLFGLVESELPHFLDSWLYATVSLFESLYGFIYN